MMAASHPAREPEWLGWLRDRTDQLGSIKAAADEVGISRTAVSLLLAGKYTAGTDKVAAKIIAFSSGDRVWCPHLQAAIGADACAAHSTAPMPMSDPAALRHWIACKTCPYRSSRP